MIPSCMGVRYLQDDEYLLRRQKIVGNEEIEKDELEELYQSRVNKKIPIINFALYAWIYQQGEQNFDSTEVEKKIDEINAKFDSKIAKNAGKVNKIRKLELNREKKINKQKRILRDGNMLMRWGEPVSVYDETSIEQTKAQMNQYLRNKGYFNGSVEYTVKTQWRRKYVTYMVEEDLPHIIDTVRILSSDTTILDIIYSHQNERLLEGNQQYDQDILVRERERVEKLLKNNGYFDFSRQYITYDVITDVKPYTLEVNMNIKEPVRREYHKQFKVDSVIFVTDADTRIQRANRSFFSYNGVTYQYYKKRFSKKVLDQRVFIYSDSLYSLDNTLNTQKQLAYLNNFKFININYDTTGGSFIANIFTSPLQKYQMTNEIGLNVSEGYPGPFYNLSLTNRNVFGGLENLQITGFFGFEGVAPVTDQEGIYTSIESGAKLALIFPQFIMPASTKFKRRIGIYNPNTIVRTGFNFTNRPEYTRTNFNNALSYNWQKERRRLYTFTLSELSFIDSETIDTFDSTLVVLERQGNPLIKSFEPSFVSSMNAQVVYNYNPDDLYGNKSSILKLYAEAGGTVFNFYDPQELLVDGEDTIQHFQYLKFLADFRRHISISENSGIATRLNIGVAYPYGDNNTLPYEKFFFAGGSNSIRAWSPRRLGPGSFPPRKNEDGYFDYSVEKPGEILIEANVEYRGKLVGFIDWAAFVDAGNVWNFYENPEFEGADFKFNRFYKEIAVGMGLGVRLNFSFLVIRFDYGVKMYDPAREEGERWIGGNLSLTNLRGEPGQALWNIAIGYPF
jgi:outer membrane protein insertion porin family